MAKNTAAQYYGSFAVATTTSFAYEGYADARVGALHSVVQWGPPGDVPYYPFGTNVVQLHPVIAPSYAGRTPPAGLTSLTVWIPLVTPLADATIPIGGYLVNWWHNNWLSHPGVVVRFNSAGAGTEDPSYPFSRMQDGRSDTDGRFTASGWGQIFIDLTNGYGWIPVDWFSIHGHNLTVNANLYGSHNGLFSYPADYIGTLQPGMSYMKLTTARAFRYWLVSIDANPVPIRIEEMMLGTSVAVSLTPDIPIAVTRSETLVVEQSEGGNPYVWPKTTKHRRQVAFNFTAKTAAQMKELRDTLLRNTEGSRYPVAYAPLNTEEEVYFGYLTPGVEFSMLKPNRNVVQIVLTEGEHSGIL